ncbi:SH3 domain-containing protein [Niallia sp. 03133]|uniref:SH3 domain-containing protein n=1 Tax=Niallia sp. 03133 TaxID=3458060 RepID=UPI004045167E
MKRVVVPGFFLAALSSPILVHEVHANSIKDEEIKKYVVVDKGSTLNVRKLPSTSSSVITKLKNGEEVFVSTEANGWSKITINGQTGYVSSEFLKKSDASKKISTVSKSTTSQKTIVKYINVDKGSSLNMRTKPSDKSSIIVKLAKGVSVTYYSESNGWAKVKVYGKEGYVASKYLSNSKTFSSDSKNTIKQSSSITATTKIEMKYVNVDGNSFLNLRSSASSNGSILARLSRGAKAEILSEKNGWSKIKVNNKTGYVSSQYLSLKKPVDDTKKPAAVSSTTIMYVNVEKNSTLNMRSSGTSSSKIVAKLKRGLKVEVYSQSKGWAKIKTDNKVGYVNTEFLTKNKITDAASSEPNQQNSSGDKEKTTIKYVAINKGTSLNVRKSPSTSADIIKKLTNNTEVSVLSEKSGWSKIKVENVTGYVSTSFLKDKKIQSEPENKPNENNTDGSNNNQPAEIKMFVNVAQGSSLNMREKPSTYGKIISKLPANTLVVVYSVEKGWAKVSANGNIGYVSSEFLKEDLANPPASNGLVHTNYQKYGITLDEMTGIQMDANPQTDKKYNTYIREDALVFKTADSTKGTVLGNGWRLRGGAGTEYWVTNKVNSGEQLTVVAKVKGSDGYYWYQVNNTQSWVSASKEDTSYYINPKNFAGDKVSSMQFLKLSETANIYDIEVNEKILAGKGILSGKASAFVAAANAYGINEIYLISHALLETGSGASTLANGVTYNGKTVYNMYGIGAYDNSAITSGAKYAYNAGWFTPEAAIIGGAKFIAQGYINAGQDTLYKMRWNPNAAGNEGVATHQYASDIGWAAKQVSQIYNLYNLLNSYTIKLEIPEYK